MHLTYVNKPSPFLIECGKEQIRIQIEFFQFVKISFYQINSVPIAFLTIAIKIFICLYFYVHSKACAIVVHPIESYIHGSHVIVFEKRNNMNYAFVWICHVNTDCSKTSFKLLTQLFTVYLITINGNGHKNRKWSCIFKQNNNKKTPLTSSKFNLHIDLCLRKPLSIQMIYGWIIINTACQYEAEKLLNLMIGW